MAARFIPALLIVTAVLVTNQTRGQEMYYLSNRLQEKAEAAKAGARDIIERLAAYPNDVRDAGLELSQYPELLLRLRGMANATPEATKELVDRYPVEVMGAAARLAEHPEIIAMMGEYIIATSLVGEIYRDQPAIVRQIVASLGERLATIQIAANSAWGRRLERTPVAKSQLVAAQTEYGQQSKRPLPSFEGLPPAELVKFILAGADRYPELASQLIEQWERERNPEPFRAVVDYWYAQRRDMLPDRLSDHPENKDKMIKEQALLEQEYRDALRAGNPFAADRSDFIARHLQKYPSLLAARKEKILAFMQTSTRRFGGAPWTSGGGGGGSSSSSSSSGGSVRTTPRTTSPSRSSSGSSSSGGGGFFGGGNDSGGGFGGSSSSGFGSSSGSSGFGGSSGSSSRSSGFGSSGASSSFGSSRSGFGSSRSGSSSR